MVGSRLRLQVLVPIMFTIVALERGLFIILIKRVTPLSNAVRLMTVRVGHWCCVVWQPVLLVGDENRNLDVVPKATVSTAVWYDDERWSVLYDGMNLILVGSGAAWCTVARRMMYTCGACG